MMAKTTTKGYKAKSAKGNGMKDQVQRKTGTSFQESSSGAGNVTHLIPPVRTCDNMC